MTDAELIQDIINEAEKQGKEIKLLKQALERHTDILEHLSNEITLLVMLAKYNEVVDVCIDIKRKGEKDGTGS